MSPNQTTPLLIGLLMTCCPAITLAGTVNSVPAGFTECAKDFGTCTINGDWSGYYGANSTFVEIKGANNFTCLPGSFGIADPVPNVQKTCYVKQQEITAGYLPCAVDFGQCQVEGSWTGYYGANATYASIKGTGAFTCLPGSFGIADPVPNVQKTCYIKLDTTTQTTTQTNTETSAPAACKPYVVNSQSSSGFLHAFIDSNEMDRFKAELKKGSNPDVLEAPYTNKGPTLPEGVYSSLVGYAAYVCKPAYVKVMLDACANPNAQHNTGPTPLDLANKAGCTEAANLITAAGGKPAAPVAPAPKTYPSLAMAATEADYATIKKMIANGSDINVKSSSGQTILMVAVDYQNVDAVKALLEAGAKVDEYTKSGNHVLHLIAKAKTPEGSLAYSQKLRDITKLIWQKCPQRRPRDANGKTPLDWIEYYARRSEGQARMGETQSMFYLFTDIKNGPAPGTSCP